MTRKNHYFVPFFLVVSTRVFGQPAPQPGIFKVGAGDTPKIYNFNSSDTSGVWFAIYDTREFGTLELKRVRPIFQDIHGTGTWLVGDTNDPPTFNTDENHQPYYVCGHVPGLRPGSVHGNLYINHVHPPIGDSLFETNDTIRQGKINIIIREKGSPVSSSRGLWVWKNLTTSVEIDGRKQVLAKSRLSGFAGDSYWFGDLDNDGKPDIIFDADMDDHHACLKLFLSSLASGQALVHLTAESGCSASEN
jgi:hypothetical protein